MAEAAVLRRPAGEAQAEEAQGGGFALWKLALGGAIYFGVNMGLGYWNRKEQVGMTITNPQTGEQATVPQNIGDIPPFQLRPRQLDEGATYRTFPKKIAPIWPQDSYVDVVVTVSPSFNPSQLSKLPEEYIVLDEKSFHMNDFKDKRHTETSFSLPKACQLNGTLWGHFYVGLSGSQLDPKEPGYDSAKAYHFAYPLTQYLPKKKVATKRNLLDDMPQRDEPEPEPDHKGPVIANYYHPNASFSFIPSLGVPEFAQMPPATKQFLRLEATGARDGSGQNGWYYPLLFVNNFWQLTGHMTELNDTVTELPIYIDLKNMMALPFQTMSTIEMNSKENLRAAAWGTAISGGGDGTEIEMIKEILIDNNPFLLGITAFATVAHMILETLAFGSDIAHYRKKKDNVGISVRSILANVFMSVVIFLYLLDNSQNTSWMILGSQVVGIFIELWKITTIVNIRIRPGGPDSWLPYTIVMEDKYKLSETEEKTKEYDEIAFKYMYMLAVPLLIAYGVYSLMYETHKSWYSFVITTLVGSVYTYGFLMMVPSLYINYRLKSVAHMPAKAMMYKFLNTFIDDLFAFTIKMPILHRLATFRDDVIFFIYLYQRWAYRIDYTRVNEFGQGGEDEEEIKDEVKAEAEAKEVTAEAVKEVEADIKAQAKTTGADKGKATKRK